MEVSDSGQVLLVTSATDTVPFTVLDEAVHHLDTAVEPWSIQLEVRVGGSLDPDRVQRAVAEAVARHPMARARRLPARRSDHQYVWEIRPKPDLDPFGVVECPDDEALAEVRADLYSRSVPLVEAPPLRVRLARCPDGDLVMVSVNHAAFDGFGAVRVLQSVARAYAGAPDPAPPVDLAEARDLERHLEAPDTGTRFQRWRALADKARDVVAAPARLAADGGSDRPGYGFHHVTVPAAGYSGPGTVNDLLLAALNMAIAGWNAEHRAPCRRISVLMPVNLRPREWRNDGVTNFVMETRVSTSAADRADSRRLLEAVAAQTERIKKSEHGALMEILKPSSRLPLWATQLLPTLLRLTGDRLVDTAVLSNMGALDDPPSFGADCETTEVWFSPPARMPCGLAIGVATLGRQMHFSFRYRHPLWDASAAGRFAQRYLDDLERLVRVVG